MAVSIPYCGEMSEEAKRLGELLNRAHTMGIQPDPAETLEALEARLSDKATVEDWWSREAQRWLGL